MTEPSSRTDRALDVWEALSDPTRRLLLDRLRAGAKATTELCKGLSITRFAVMKHLAVLECAGLVVSRKHGRVRMNHLNAAPLARLGEAWASPRAAALSAIGTALISKIEDDAMTEPLPVHRIGAIDIALDWTIAAPSARVWQTLVAAPDAWWPREMRARGENSEMRFEARLGGQLTEHHEGAGVLWYSVFAVDPGKSLDLSGALATRYGGPAISLLHLEIEPKEKSSTTLRLTDSLFGRLGPETQSHVASGWGAIVGGLIRHVEEQAGQ